MDRSRDHRVPTGERGNVANTAQDEQDVSQFRVVYDYVRSIVLSWIDRLPFQPRHKR
jgi:hypothetical protein